MTTIHNHLLPLTQWTVEDSNVLSKLRLKRKKVIPTPTEIRQNLGPRLANTVFSNVCNTTKTLIGLGKELDGPGDDLWSQPKRQLLGEIILEPFPSRRHRQALTHQAILDYGEKCMVEWENKVAVQKDIEMAEKIREVIEEMNEIMETKINQVRAKERGDFLVRIAMMEERLEKRHQREMEALERKLTEEKDAKIDEVIRTMNDSHQHETELLLDASKTLLTNRFHFKINWIQADLEEDYNTKIRAETKLINLKLKQQHHSNKCTDNDNVNNKILQNAVCTACLTADFLLKDFHQKLENLKKEMADLYECNMCLDNEIKRLEEENECFSVEVKSWECVVRDVITQFQKFIEFHLKLPQGEATHLISWEKVEELKNKMYNKRLNKIKTDKSKLTESSLPIEISEAPFVQPEAVSSINSSGICANKDIISIISSIIRQVIPSLPDLAEAEAEVNAILEIIIKQVIPSSSFLLKEEQPTHEISAGHRPCPKYLRTMQDNKSSILLSVAKSNVIEDKSNKNTDKTLDEELENRVSEITKIMGGHPNIMKFIQGP